MKRNTRRGRRFLMPGTAVVLLAVLAGCESLPDAVNPQVWYDSTVSLFSDEQEIPEQPKSQLEADRNRPPPGADQDFPTLGRVDRQEKNEALGLSADPNRPRYAPAVPRQNEPREAIAARAKIPPAKPIIPPVGGGAPALGSGVTGAPPPAVPAAEAPQVAAVPSLGPKAPEKPKAPAAPQTASKAAPPTTVVTDNGQNAEFEKIRDRLTKQLAEIKARANQPVAVPASFAAAGAPGVGGPLVISSAGVDTFGSGVAAFQAGGAPPATIAQDPGALPLPPGAIRVATIVFQNGSSALSRQDRNILGQVVALQKERGGVLRVVGHASSRTRNLDLNTHRRANLAISQKRADSVKQALLRQGARAGSVLAAAVSDSQPLFAEIMPSGEAGNRRAEIYLTN